MTGGFPPPGSGRLASPEGEAERRPFVRLRLGPDAAAVPVDDPLHDGQADAGALVVLGVVQPLEHAEELVGVAHVEADAVVLDIILRRAARATAPTADLDARDL